MIKVNYKNSIWEIYQQNGNIVLIDFSSKLENIILKREDFDILFEKKKIIILDNYSERNDTVNNIFIDDVDELPKKNLVKIEILKIYIKIDCREKNKFCKYIAEEFEYGYSETTIYRLITDFENNSRTMNFLRPKRQVRKNRLPKIIQDVIIDLIKKQYATPKRINIRHLYELIKMQLYSKKIENLIIPSYTTVCNYVQKYSNSLEIEKKRLGTKEHYKKFAPVFNGVNTTYPLERAEIDHTVLDIVVYVTDESNDIKYLEGRPLLTVIKDHHTKSFLGYYLSFIAPNTEVSLKCLKHAMQKKSKKYKDLPDEWLQFGRLKEIVADNASEFKSIKFVQACYQLGINLVYSSSYEPWLKGTVESAFNNLGPLLERLPFRIRKDIIMGQKIEDTKISFESLDYLLNFWIVSVYHNKYINSVRNTPNNLWLNTKLDDSVLEEELDNLNFELMDYQKIERTLSRKGIQFLNVRYNSSELNKIFLKNKKHNHLTVKANFLLNSEDVSYIYVIDEIDGKYQKITNISGIPENYSLRDLKLRNAKLNRKKNKFNVIYDEKLMQFNNAAENIIRKKSKNDKNDKNDKNILRGKKISSDLTRIHISKGNVDNDNYESFYDDEGLFDDN